MGRVEHIFTMANSELKPSSFTPRPSVQSDHLKNDQFEIITFNSEIKK